MTTLNAGIGWAPVDPAGRPGPAVRAEQGIEAKRILIVDDEAPITWLLQEGFEEMDCEVIAATSPGEALQLCTASSFDLVITDYKMPEMDGLALAGHVRQLQPHVRIVMLTAYGSDWLYEQAAGVGIDHVLDKPVKLSKLRSLVTELLDRGSAG
jgi:two-component system response regulator (stage 0 sporulation protein F)